MTDEFLKLLDRFKKNEKVIDWDNIKIPYEKIIEYNELGSVKDE